MPYPEQKSFHPLFDGQGNLRFMRFRPIPRAEIVFEQSHQVEESIEMKLDEARDLSSEESPVIPQEQ